MTQNVDQLCVYFDTNHVNFCLKKKLKLYYIVFRTLPFLSPSTWSVWTNQINVGRTNSILEGTKGEIIHLQHKSVSNIRV